MSWSRRQGKPCRPEVDGAGTATPEGTVRRAHTGTLRSEMTAKEKLRQAVEELTELEAEQALAFIASRRDHDPVRELFDDAPEIDEPLTPAEAASVDAAWSGRGDSVSLDELRRELG